MSEIMVKVEITDQFVHDIFVTALEGGINYWAGIRSYHWTNDRGETPDLAGFYAKLFDVDNDNRKLTINRETIVRGLRTMLHGRPGAGKVRGVAPTGTMRGMVAAAVVEQDAGLIDASLADCIVQMGLFGELVYG
jgi:hypothetical protein